MAVKKGGLGKGLDLIFMENDTDKKSSNVTLRISEIEPNRTQPRREFKEEALTELADSIGQHGVLQPLLVRPIVGGGYQIIAGERRWRACRMAGVSEVPVIIRELSDKEVMEIALIENLQREDLSAIEEAQGYQTLIDTYNFTQEEISKSVGKSRPAISNALRLLTLPQNIIEMVSEGKISAGHARTLLGLRKVEYIQDVVKDVVKRGISVRELERIVKRINSGRREKEAELRRRTRNPLFDEVEYSLHEHLGRKIKVSSFNDNKGTLQIEFYGEDDLCQLVQYFNESY